MRPLPGNRNNKWQSSLGAQRNAEALNCYDATCLCISAVAPVIWRRRLAIVCISLLLMLPAAFWTLKNATFDHTSTAANLALGHIMQDGHATTAAAQEAKLLGQHMERQQAWPCVMILSVRAMSPRAAWAANTSASMSFVTRVVVLRHSNWQNNYRGASLWLPPLQLLGKNISVLDSSTEEDKYSACSAAMPHEKACIFWNADYNVAAALPSLFHLFLRDTQKLAVAVDANRLIASAQLHVNVPAGSVHSAFSSPDIAAIGEVGAVRNSFDSMRLHTTSQLRIGSAMSVAADVFVPFFFNSPPQLLHINAPLANALGEVKILRDNEFERRARRADMYERAAAVLHARASLTGGADASFNSDAVVFRAMCAAQHCAFMTDLPPAPAIHIQAPSNSSASLLSLQPLMLQKRILETIDSTCLTEPDRSCRCCPSPAISPLLRAVDALPLTHWTSPPLRHASFFGLDFLMPVRLRSITVDVGHNFQSALIVEVLHSLSDAWLPLHSIPQVAPPLSTKGAAGSSGSDGGSKHTYTSTRFIYNLERELRDLWRLQTGAFPGARMPVFSVQMIRFRSAASSPHPFVVYEIKYETATEDAASAARSPGPVLHWR